MRKVILGLAILALLCPVAVMAQTVAADFEEASADGDPLGGTWAVTYSGSSSGCTNITSVYSTEQANGGTYSGKMEFSWDGASGGVARVQPTSAPDISNGGGDHTADPVASVAVYGNNSGDEFQVYMNDTGYESFTEVVNISFTGWQNLQWNCSTSPVVGWITGDSSLDVTNCRFDGFFFRQNAAAATYVYYLDDFQFLPEASSVEGWFIY